MLRFSEPSEVPRKLDLLQLLRPDRNSGVLPVHRGHAVLHGLQLPAREEDREREQDGARYEHHRWAQRRNGVHGSPRGDNLHRSSFFLLPWLYLRDQECDDGRKSGRAFRDCDCHHGDVLHRNICALNERLWPDRRQRGR